VSAVEAWKVAIDGEKRRSDDNGAFSTCVHCAFSSVCVCGKRSSESSHETVTILSSITRPIYLNG